MDLSPIIFLLGTLGFMFIIAKTWTFCMTKLEKQSSHRDAC